MHTPTSLKSFVNSAVLCAASLGILCSGHAIAEEVPINDEVGQIVLITKYEGCVVTGVDSDSISITHAAGIARIPFSALPENLQQKFESSRLLAEAREKEAARVAKTRPADTAAPSQETGGTGPASPDFYHNVARISEQNKARQAEREQLTRDGNSKVEAMLALRAQAEAEAAQRREEANARTKKNADAAAAAAKNKKKNKNK